ncbi:MAG: L-threonylcarbamoyladenylate synthase [Armatimonadota bacterium]
MTDARVVSVSQAGLEAAVSAAVEALGGGAPAVIPTDTVYGLAGSLYDPGAIRAIFRAKDRPPDMPLPVLVASTAEAERLVPGELEAHEALLDRFWPGALTVIVSASERIPAGVTAGRSTVGLREADSRVARAILRGAGGALAVTSANISGRPPACEVSELPDELLRQVAVVIDAGPCPGGTASTVLDLSAHPPRLLRHGPITRDELVRHLPDLQ